MLDTQILRLPVEAIAPNPYQPRTDFAPEPLAELADSIRRHGILQPLTVRRTKTGWELVAGERRLRAAKLAGLDTVPCLQIRAEDQESALLALIENIQRKDLHYFEEAAAIAAYLRQSGVTQEEAAALLGRSPSALANKLRLLQLTQDQRQFASCWWKTGCQSAMPERCCGWTTRRSGFPPCGTSSGPDSTSPRRSSMSAGGWRPCKPRPPQAAAPSSSRMCGCFSTVWIGGCGWFGRRASARSPAGRTRRTPFS